MTQRASGRVAAAAVPHLPLEETYALAERLAERLTAIELQLELVRNELWQARADMSEHLVQLDAHRPGLVLGADEARKAFLRRRDARPPQSVKGRRG